MDLRDIQPDVDPQETREWLEALDSVLEREGPARANFLLERLVEKARRDGAYIPYNANTAYMNTIPLAQEERSPGDAELEHKIRSLVRWNAMAMVLRANKESSELGGHIASFASAATLYDVGFNHFFRAGNDSFGGDLVYFQGHSAPGIYARAYLEGRITEEQLNNFRQEVGGKGLSSYPHPWLMPDFWQFPTVSMGLGPLMAIYQARFMRYLQGPRHRRHRRAARCGASGRRRDGRAGIAGRDLARRARAARQPDLRHQLQPAAARRAGARQRQDHPGAGSRFPRRRLERDQGDLGLVLGSAVHARQERPAAAAHGGVRGRRVPGLQVARRRLRAQAFLRQVSRAARDGRAHVGRRHLAPEPRRPRSAQDVRRLRGGDEAQGPADGDPRQDRQGLRHGRGGRRPEHHPSAEEDGHGLDQGVPRPLRRADPRRQARGGAVLPAARGQPRDEVPAGAGRRRWAAACPRGGGRAQPLEVPPLSAFEAAAERHRRPRDLHHDGVRAHTQHHHPRQEHRQARGADRAGRIAHLRHGGHVPPARHLFPRRASSTRRRTPTS